MIAEEILVYCESHSSPETEVLQRLTRETHLTQVYPRMLTGHLQGTFLRLVTAMLQPRRILEIGTFTGYSAICMGSSGGGVLHTIEINPELEPIIRKYIAEAGLTDIVRLHIGDAVQIIPMLEETWDLVYIDADKPSYLKYYDLVLPRVRPGGFILADNALWDGRVLDPAATDKDTRGIIEFNDFVMNDESVENVLLPVRDGIMLIKKLIR